MLRSHCDISQQIKKHFLKCCSIIDVCKKPDSQGAAKHRSHRAVESLAVSPKRMRVISVVTRRKVTSCMGWSPKLVAKLPLRSRSKRVHIIVHTLLGLAQQVAVKEMWARHLAVIRVTKSQRNTARSCIRSHVINARFWMFNFFHSTMFC